MDTSAFRAALQLLLEATKKYKKNTKQYNVFENPFNRAFALTSSLELPKPNIWHRFCKTISIAGLRADYRHSHCTEHLTWRKRPSQNNITRNWKQTIKSLVLFFIPLKIKIQINEQIMFDRSHLNSIKTNSISRDCLFFLLRNDGLFLFL